MSQKASPKKENLMVSLILNIALPIFLLSKGSALLTPTGALLCALVFPLAYCVYDYFSRKIINPIAIIGFFSTLIKGSFALFKLSASWFALSEAAIPTFLGIYMVLSLKIGKPLINYFIFNENVFNLPLLEQKLKEMNAQEKFDKVLWHVTLAFGFVFLAGGFLNYILALNIITANAGTEEFNLQFARMTFLGHFIVLIPKMIMSMSALWWFIHKIKKLTGLKMSEFLASQ